MEDQHMSVHLVSWMYSQEKVGGIGLSVNLGPKITQKLIWGPWSHAEPSQTPNLVVGVAGFLERDMYELELIMLFLRHPVFNKQKCFHSLKSDIVIFFPPYLTRRWVLQQLIQENSLPTLVTKGNLEIAPTERIQHLVKEEMDVCCEAAGRYPSNYNAWSHRIWVLQHLAKLNTEV